MPNSRRIINHREKEIEKSSTEKNHLFWLRCQKNESSAASRTKKTNSQTRIAAIGSFLALTAKKA